MENLTAASDRILLPQVTVEPNVEWSPQGLSGNLLQYNPQRCKNKIKDISWHFFSMLLDIYPGQWTRSRELDGSRIAAWTSAQTSIGRSLVARCRSNIWRMELHSSYTRLQRVATCYLLLKCQPSAAFLKGRNWMVSTARWTAWESQHRNCRKLRSWTQAWAHLVGDALQGGAIWWIFHRPEPCATNDLRGCESQHLRQCGHHSAHVERLLISRLTLSQLVQSWG